MERFPKAYLLVVLCSFLYVQSVWSATQTPITSITCTADANCTKVDVHSVCGTGSPKNCTCKSDYKSNGNICVVKVVGEPCTQTSDCHSNATCNTNKTCSCNKDHTAENGLCRFAVGAGCTQKTDCVKNADCDATTKKCKCSSGFSASKGLCAKESSADSVKKTINAIVVLFLCAALLSII